jgi:hypothetical protein
VLPLEYLALAAFLPNAQDRKIVEELSTARAGSLEIDQFVGTLNFRDVRSLRAALNQVYVSASYVRNGARAIQDDLGAAEMALSKLEEARGLLFRVIPDWAFGIHVALCTFGDQHGDVNDLASMCKRIVPDLLELVQKLSAAVEAERAKVPGSGERTKRLRTLVEALCALWQRRRRKRPTVSTLSKSKNSKRTVVGRGGLFLDFARALLARMDEFTDSQVTSAVRNARRK